MKVSQLKCSARIFHDGMEIRLHNEGCLFLIDDSFMARVELMHAVPVLSAGHFAQAKTALFRLELKHQHSELLLTKNS